MFMPSGAVCGRGIPLLVNASSGDRPYRDMENLPGEASNRALTLVVDAGRVRSLMSEKLIGSTSASPTVDVRSRDAADVMDEWLEPGRFFGENPGGGIET